jgi:hypothetical protein
LIHNFTRIILHAFTVDYAKIQALHARLVGPRDFEIPGPVDPRVVHGMFVDFDVIGCKCVYNFVMPMSLHTGIIITAHAFNRFSIIVKVCN